MSIEQLIKENTAALVALTETLITQITSAPLEAKPATAKAKQEDKKTSLPAEEKTEVAQEVKPEPKPETAATAPDYDAASTAVLALVKAAGKPAAIALLAEFGAKVTGEVPAERFAELIAKAKVIQEAQQ